MGIYLMWGVLGLVLLSLLVFFAVPGLGFVALIGAVVDVAVIGAAATGTFSAETRRERRERRVRRGRTPSA